MQASSWDHKFIHFHLFFWIWKVWKGRGKNYKNLNIVRTKSFLDEIKIIFHSFWRGIIWWKNTQALNWNIPVSVIETKKANLKKIVLYREHGINDKHFPQSLFISLKKYQIHFQTLWKILILKELPSSLKIVEDLLKIFKVFNIFVMIDI